jgi:hypothetical protein
MSHVACKETERIRCAVWHQRKRNNLTKEAAIEHVAKIRGLTVEYVRSKVKSMRNKVDKPVLSRWTHTKTARLVGAVAWRISRIFLRISDWLPGQWMRYPISKPADEWA